ncbi:hypothetical protein GOL99_26810 [Sinorhizobium medicae]|nr:hypothetical protein [Sinorhizobium medicae]
MKKPEAWGPARRSPVGRWRTVRRERSCSVGACRCKGRGCARRALVLRSPGSRGWAVLVPSSRLCSSGSGASFAGFERLGGARPLIAAAAVLAIVVVIVALIHRQGGDDVRQSIERQNNEAGALRTMSALALTFALTGCGTLAPASADGLRRVVGTGRRALRRRRISGRSTGPSSASAPRRSGRKGVR